MQMLKKTVDILVRFFNSILEYSRKSRGSLVLTAIIFYLFFGGAIASLIIQTVKDIKQLFSTGIESPGWKIIGILADIASLLSVTTAMFFAYMRYRSHKIRTGKFEQALRIELRRNATMLERVGIDIFGTELLASIQRKMTPLYADLYERLDDIEAFAYDFYEKLAKFISKYCEHDKIFSKFIFYLLMNENQAAAPLFRRDYAKEDFTDPKSVNVKALLLYSHYADVKISDSKEFNPTFYDSAEVGEETAVSDIYQKVFSPEQTQLYKVLQEKSMLEISENLLSHLVEKSYAILTDSTNTPIDLQPLILVKNSEDFSYYWKPLNEQIRVEMRKSKKFTADQIKNYNLPRDNKVSVISPFFEALREDANFIQVPNYKKSPVFMVMPEDLPRPYKYKVVPYIEAVITKEANRLWKKTINGVLKVYPYLKNFEKELVFDYELFPFDPTKIDVHSRQDRLPIAFTRLLVSKALVGEKKNQFIKVNLLEITALLRNIGPFSLITKALPKISVNELKNYELKFLNKIGTKANGSIRFEGIEQIASSSQNTNRISELLYDTVHGDLKTFRLTKVLAREVIQEIIKNATALYDKTSKG